MKINEIISEALNTGTGTPNADPEQAWDQDTYTGHVDPKTVQTPDFSGLQRAKQGAAMLGRGIKQGAGAIGKGLQAGWRGAEKAAGATADAIGDMAQGAQQYIPGTQDRAAKLANQQNAKPWIDRWNQGVRANPEINTPEQLQQFATKLTTNRNGQQLFQVPVPKDMSRAGVAEYLTNIVARVSAGVERPSPATSGNKPAQTTQATQPTEPEQPATTAPNGTQTTPGGIIVPQTVGGGARKEQPAQTSAPADRNVQQQALAQGVTIKNQDPIIISTGKGKEYGLDDNGQWIHLASGRVQPETLQAFLDQQHNVSLGIK